MKITNIRIEDSDEEARAVCSVVWEDVDRPVQDVFFSVPPSFRGILSANPHAFLVGSILPAVFAGERRISLDGRLCADLAEGLHTIVDVFRHWYGAHLRMPLLEAKA
jgi:hypothetical protein